MSERRYDIDNIRVLATLAIFLFHNVRLFDTMGWHVKNAETAVPATIFVGMLDAFLMPLFFLLSGVGAWYGLSRRSGWDFLKERAFRLLIPLYTVGLFLLIPPQYIMDQMTNGVVFGSIPEGYVHFFEHIRFGFEPPFIYFFTGHLWFLFFLFYISLAVLPVLLWLRSERGSRVRDYVAGRCAGKVGPFVFALPLFVALFALRGVFSGDHTWADFVYFSLYFLIGYIAASDTRIFAATRRFALAGLILGVVGFGAEGYLVLAAGYPMFNQSFGDMPQYIIFQVVMSLQTLGWVTAVLGYGGRFLREQRSWTAVGNEAVLPFYILHQTAILLVGYYVVRLDWGIPAKLVLALVASFCLIVAVYRTVVRPFSWVRFLFGMRSKR